MVTVDGVDLDTQYVVKVPYNGTEPTGGDPLQNNLNIFYEVGPMRSPRARPTPGMVLLSCLDGPQLYM